MLRPRSRLSPPQPRCRRRSRSGSREGVAGASAPPCALVTVGAAPCPWVTLGSDPRPALCPVPPLRGPPRGLSVSPLPAWRPLLGAPLQLPTPWGPAGPALHAGGRGEPGGGARGEGRGPRTRGRSGSSGAADVRVRARRSEVAGPPGACPQTAEHARETPRRFRGTKRGATPGTLGRGGGPRRRRAAPRPSRPPAS